MLKVRFRSGSVIILFFLVLFWIAIIHGWEWPYIAKLMPVYFVAIPAVLFCLIELWRDLYGSGQWEGAQQQKSIDMDEVFRGGLDRWTEISRTVVFLCWLAAGAGAIWLLGITIALPVFVLAYALVEGQEKWSTCLLLATGTFAFLWGVFDYFLNMRWPAGALFG